jgi:hypothetical protein
MKIWDFNGFDGIPAIYDRLSEINPEDAAVMSRDCADRLAEVKNRPRHLDKLTEVKNRPG